MPTFYSTQNMFLSEAMFGKSDLSKKEMIQIDPQNKLAQLPLGPIWQVFPLLNIAEWNGSSQIYSWEK